ncbi:hypothetical protein thsps21_51940 [Pseudomonas sp. No.21]|uniref:hypothetical protein n=1 Tax=Pseudomonas TaxID=286 RepID=UPI000DA8D2CC|nr:MULTISPECIES: hypothetical protein [Pseudomonas]MDW3716206.1 hypothetical protein [Pseudomonas sp. 2023EL-01195]PZE10296.1 hypothetical protein DMX10_26820 [Pseudomonas sp. 57B-090624]GJN48482.1 hypothetical protein TUM20249_44680 [Pseudomonas tohonis]
MQRNLFVTAAFTAFALSFTQFSFAEESSAFVARNAQYEQRAQDAAQQEAIAKQGTERKAESGQDS